MKLNRKENCIFQALRDKVNNNYLKVNANFKMIQVLTILLIFLLSTLICQTQLDDPMTLAQAIFSKDTFPDLHKHISGEYDGHPNGTDLSDNVTTKFLLLDQNEKTAVVNLTISDSIGKEFDTYLHFKKEGVWKVTAFRALALTGIIYEAHRLLESMTAAQVDSIIALSQNDTLGISLFKSRKEYEFQLGNTGLTIASDRELIVHFKKNEKEFERIKDSILSQIDKMKIDQERKHRFGEEFELDYQKLFISSISSGGYQFGNAINFFIGGMVDNSVGYIFVKNKKDVPDMNPSRIIMIREIGNGWYLYKTT